MITEKDGIKNITGKMWRVVHDGEKVVAVIEGTETNVTSTSHSVMEFETQEECLAAIGCLGLKYDPEETEEQDIK